MTKTELKKEIKHLKYGLSLVEKYTHKSKTLKSQAKRMKNNITNLEKKLNKKR